MAVISSGGLALYPIETALKSIYNLKQGRRITSAAEFLTFVEETQKCCVSSLRLVIFDEEIPDAQKAVSQAKQMLLKSGADKECAFVALVDQSKMMTDGKPFSKN